MKSLIEYLKEAKASKTAIGHFNTSDSFTLKTIFNTAKKLSLPVIIGVSESEREFIGVPQIAALVHSLRNEYNYPIFLNADHTHSLDKIREAAIADFDEVIFDGSSLSLEENINKTKEAVKIAKSINPNILVEGEIGFIGNSSSVMDRVPDGIEQTKPEDAKRFVQETGVDILAPSVGNMHGMLKSMVDGGTKKRLNIQLIQDLEQQVNTFMTLHGGSGTSDEDFCRAIKYGMNIVHVNTEIRIAWRRGIEAGLKDNPQEVAPYKILPQAISEISQVVENRLKLFSTPL